jgi:UDP-2,3-diacylglucosamine pyrophosphatase LpxH
VVLKKLKPEKPQFPELNQIILSNVSVPKISPKKDNIKTSVIIGDSQIGFRKIQGKLEPYHDRTAMDLTLQLIDYIKPDEIIILGDMIDCSEASKKFIKEPGFYFTTQSALTEMAFFLMRIKSVSNANIIYLAGNHEDRLKNYAYEYMAFAYTLKTFGTDYSILSLKNLLNLEQLGVNYLERYPQDSYWINDNLRVVHGEYININKELANSRISTIQGHKHTIEKIFKTSHGRHGIEKMFVESIGCLCNIDGSVPGKSQPNWQQGICVVNTVDKYFDTHAVVYHDGVTIYDNKIFTGRDYSPEIDIILKNEISVI